MLKEWFGFESVDAKIKKELSSIETVLTEVLEIEKIIQNKEERKKKLKQILLTEKKAIDFGLKIEEELENTLEQYIAGEKKTKNLMKILILHNLLRDLKNDPLWLELQHLWNEEYALLDSDDEKRLMSNILEQKHIVDCLKQIIELEFNETHMHVGMSVDAVMHWDYLKKLWKKSLEGKAPKEYDIRTFYEKNEYMSQEDKKTIKKIMDNYFLGKWNEAKAFTEFEKLIIMAQEDVGCFHGFQKKAAILNVIQEVLHPESLKKKYYTDAIDLIAKHNLAHNVTHIEIRFPTQQYYLGSMKEFAEIAKEIEEKYDNRITIRYVEFVIHGDPRQVFETYKKQPKKIQKYFVAIDIVGKHEEKWAIELAKKSPLPVCVHAGEFFSQKDFPDRTPAENVEHALREVERALNVPKINRLGHANVIGLNIPEYLVNVDKKDIQRLVLLQDELVEQIKKKNVVIEANPTSNIMIRGITYVEHPIAAFQEKEIPFAISTDDRVTFDTTLKKEFFRIARALRWKEREIALAAKMQKEAKLK